MLFETQMILHGFAAPMYRASEGVVLHAVALQAAASVTGHMFATADVCLQTSRLLSRQKGCL